MVEPSAKPPRLANGPSREGGRISSVSLGLTAPHLPRMTAQEWVICVISSIAFAFDVYEVIILPLIVRPALAELGQMRSGSPDFNRWVGLLIFVPALCGGIFGLMGGYLTDRIGRRRVLFFSIVLYALAAVGAAYSQSPIQLLVWRCMAVSGVSVEFVAGIAWLVELFPDARQREAVLGYSQAFSAAGGFILSAVYYMAVTFGTRLPAIRGHHSGWRYAIFFGLFPAIPLVLVRPFLPESPVWRRRKQQGTLKRPSFAELFRPELFRNTVISALMVACCYAAAFGSLQHIPRIIPGLAEVRNLAPLRQEQIISASHLYADCGQLGGRFAFAILTTMSIAPRRLLSLFLMPGLVAFPLVFFYAGRHDLATLQWGSLLAAALVTAQMSYWGNYLPRLFPLHLRGTGESFATNVGGRMIGNGAAVLTTQLANIMPGNASSVRLTLSAGLVGVVVSLMALGLSIYLPTPRHDLTE